MVQPITDHVAQGLSRLIEQYKGKPRIQGFLESWLEEVQELSDAAWAVILSRLVDHATGHHLRVLGKIAGQPWREESDERFRVLVRARIAANISSGTVDDLLRVASLVLGAATFELTELFPATVIVDVSSPIDFADLAFELLRDAKAGGVAFSLHWFDGHEADAAFTWADGDEFQEDADRGFGGDDPEVGPGGMWIGDF